MTEDNITITITTEDFQDSPYPTFKETWVRLVHSKLKEAGVPVNTIGINPVVKEGFLYREDLEDKSILTWSKDALTDS